MVSEGLVNLIWVLLLYVLLRIIIFFYKLKDYKFDVYILFLVYCMRNIM